MRILIDIGHPAHVHYFRNFIKIMEERGNKFLIVARDKDVTQKLLNRYEMSFISRGKGAKGIVGKLFYVFKANKIIYKVAKNWKPHIFLSFGSPYASQVSMMFSKPHIALTDTEHDKIGNIGFTPFTETIITPDCYLDCFKTKHIRIRSFFELGYLLPKYFKPDKNILKELKISPNQKVVLFRFVSWNAFHDRGHNGISLDKRKLLIDLFIDNNYKVLISDEGDLSQDFKDYRISISPEKIHSLIKAVDFFIGESGTMATEAAVLGTPSVFVNSLDAGVFQDEVKYELLYSFRNDENIIKIIKELIKNDRLKEQHLEKRDFFLKEKIDFTAFLVWFIENYPKSKAILKNNLDYQLKFK